MRRRVAITGIGAISALGADPRSMWAAAAQGQSGIDRITCFDASTFSVQLGAQVQVEPLVPERHAFWHREDPKIAFGLHAAIQAMRDAGLERLPVRSLVHAGTSLEYFDPRKIVQAGSADLQSALNRFGQSESGTNARPLQVSLDTLNQCLDEIFGAPLQSLTNVSACAASTQAIGHAFRRIRDGSFDMALCGGFDSMLNPFGVGGFQLLGALSTDTSRGSRACRPFDAARSGAVLGEGSAFLVLEDLEKARAEGRFIHGEILGYGSSLDACKLSAPDPQGQGARAAMLGALQDAGMSAAQVDAVSAHATGTLLNDEVEAAAIRAVLPHWQRVPVLATKSLLGHLIGAAGAVEVVMALQGFHEQRLHPNGSLELVAAGCELDHVRGEARAFHGRTVLKNSFGFGGQNASLLLGRVEVS